MLVGRSLLPLTVPISEFAGKEFCSLQLCSLCAIDLLSRCWSCLVCPQGSKHVKSSDQIEIGMERMPEELGVVSCIE